MWSYLLVACLLALLIKKLLLREKSDIDKLPYASHVFQFLGLTNVEIWLQMREFTRKHGDRYVIRGFNNRLVIHTSRPDDMEVLLSHPRNIKKGIPYRFLEPWLGKGLLISDGSKWLKRRKILTPTFHFNILKNFAIVIEAKSRDLVNHLNKEKTDLFEVDVLKVISDCTLYTICETAMGMKLDSNTEKQRVYKESILQLGPMVMRRIARVWFWWGPFYYLFPEGRAFKLGVKRVRNFADDVIIKKKIEKQMELEKSNEEEGNEIGTKKRLALLDLLLESEMKGEIDLDGIREEVNTFMFEGHDTTAMALTFGLMLLAEHQDVQEKILAECKKVLGDSDRVLAITDLAHMKYLEAVIKEILRLYPSVPFISRDISEDFQMGDILVKKGTEVALHFFEMHRRKDLFEDPEEFRPQRFLEPTPRHPYSYVPFSAGPRNCIGQRFAIQEMKCILSEIIRNFKLSPSSRNPEPRLLMDIVIRPESNIYVNFAKRNK